ncbi:oocyte zinc finger protein XlCOF6-like [Cloeon dipterum]|uniref:oocyte zinc finger protein XlCOF6-like n=1 Tax=Cloeon dipterum TaxID=197152 RepID=UPI00321F8AC4
MERHCRTRSLRSREMQPPRVGEAKPAIQKPLCRLCECPTSDGHVLASQVDRFKLRKWAMEVMNLTEEDENLPEVVEEDALICYFCIWQAEFGDESGDEAVAWWPENLDLEENARVLRENYSVGEVEQCWVQLEEVDLAEYEKEIPKKKKCVSGVCLYCGNRFERLMGHVKAMHKEAIKCGIRGCTTYFHTEEEKEQHMQHDCHKKREKPNESSKISCKFCKDSKLYSSRTLWKRHMRRMHPELVACTRLGCIEYFKSKSEMLLHVDSWHKQDTNLFECKQCEFFSNSKFVMRNHQLSKHKPKMFKCDSCDAKFGSKQLVNRHFKKFHTFDVCKSCGQDVSVGYMPTHRRPSACSKCKLKFTCSGLYQSHWKSCKQNPYSCKECGESFNERGKLYRHVKKFHTLRITKLRCDHCDYSTITKSHMLWHMQCNHLPKTIKCADCNRLFGSESILNNHKYKMHEYVHCAECAQEIIRQNMFNHLIIKTCRHCECKFKCQGLLEKHGCLNLQSNNFYCDKCPKFYSKKLCLYSHIVTKHIDV